MYKNLHFSLSASFNIELNFSEIANDARWHRNHIRTLHNHCRLIYEKEQ